MAKILSVPTTLTKLVTKARQRVIITGLVIALCVAAGFLISSWFYLGALSIIPLWSRAVIKRKIITSGQVGEQVTAQVLAALPKEYVVLHDLFLCDGLRTAQIDHLVLGPNGIFLFETKNHQGIIEGYPEELYWVQKRPQLGSDEIKIHNPIKQAQSHAYVLRGLINSNSPAIFGNRHMARYLWVQPVVVFTNPNTEVRIEGKCSTPVIRPHEVVDWVINYQARFTMTPEQINRMARVILNHIRRDFSGEVIAQS
jgi:hypothetical protein